MYRVITWIVMIIFQLGGEELMGRKPVRAAAGTLMISLALAGCQSSNPRPAQVPFTPPSAAATNQNKTTPDSTATPRPLTASNTTPSYGLGQSSIVPAQGTSTTGLGSNSPAPLSGA